MKIRTVIVDDEPWARKRIETLLGNEADFEILRTCSNGDEAIEAISTLAPDVVFLDVQMSGVDGFDVVDAIGVDAMPYVIFATAHQEYALRAFDAQALDYLLKPFDEDRFRRALDRVRKDVNGLFAEVNAYNRTRTFDEERRFRVWFYFGQNVERPEDGEGRSGE